MWYKKANGQFLSVNCQVQPNSDVSGTGVCSALYLQAITALLISSVEQSPAEAFLSNFVLLGGSFALIVGAYFDSDIDVPHCIIASQFAVLLSVCRTQPSTVSLQEGRVKSWVKMVSGMVLMERCFRIFLLTFNFILWK